VNTIIHDALQLGAQGYPVFPCRMDKRPACQHGFYDAVRGAGAIEDLWRLYPGELVGVRAGITFDCLDIDAKHEAVHAWWGKHRHDIPATRTHRTRSGGLHLLFGTNAVMPCSAGKLAPGVDTRGAGGYVIWWPAEGLEELHGSVLAAVPGWILDALRPKEQAAPVTTCRHEAGDAWLRGLVRVVAGASQGQRNQALFWAACRAGEAIRAGKATREWAANVLIDAASRAGLAASEAQRTISSGFAREDRP